MPVAVPGDGAIADRRDRMARFAAGAGQVVARAAAVGVLLAAGWLLAMVFGMFSADPAAASATHTSVAAGSVMGDFPTAGDAASVMDNAEAMAGLRVDGLTSQSTPGMPDPSTMSKNMGANGLAPNGGGNGPFGPSVGDVVARSVFDPRLVAQRAPLACLLPPVVRTAADDPSFSPD
ncbi:hypothetical protein [Nonomuraea typhae]|uniref:hypothetical protein n=1 Tax=Nonomuraea typhae TaxID=2603600 RepID=UPI001FE9FB8A|nr:hypothetical protein [Nonomuraea typhae]